MKITTSTPLSPVGPTPGSEPRQVDRATPTGGTRVSLSEDARFVAAVADEARKAPEIRQDVVERTRAALADGSFDASVDLDKVVDRLLADL